MIDGRNLFDQPVKNDTRTHDNIRKFVTVQGDGYTTSGLFAYTSKKISIDLSN